MSKGKKKNLKKKLPKKPKEGGAAVQESGESGTPNNPPTVPPKP